MIRNTWWLHACPTEQPGLCAHAYWEAADDADLLGQVPGGLEDDGHGALILGRLATAAPLAACSTRTRQVDHFDQPWKRDDGGGCRSETVPPKLAACTSEGGACPTPMKGASGGCLKGPLKFSRTC